MFESALLDQRLGAGRLQRPPFQPTRQGIVPQ